MLEASDGRQTLEVVDSEMPDLILLDVMMPEMDGIEVLPSQVENFEPPGIRFDLQLPIA